MQDHLGVGRTLEEHTLIDESAAELPRVGQISVVSDGQIPQAVVHSKGLDVHRVARGTTRTVAIMTDGGIAVKGLVEDIFIVKNLKHQAKVFVNPHHLFPSDGVEHRGDDTGRFLTTVLKGVKAIIRQQSGFGVIIDSEDAAVVFRLIDHGVLNMD